MTALEVAGLTVAFGGRLALRDVSIAVAAGEAVGVVGPNGAGKTTLIDAVSGFVPYQGRVLVAGQSVDRCPPHERVERGIARTFQSVELFDDLSVGDNVAMSPMSTRSSIAAALALTGLDAVADRRAGSLARSLRNLAGLARALATGPRVLLLDELAAGVSAPARSSLLCQLREVMSSGVSLVVVDHDVELIDDLCTQVVALDAGAVIARGESGDLRGRERDDVHGPDNLGQQ